MSPDELPADMEAVVARLEVSAIDPVPWPDLRDLMKAYQKQRRAFRALFESISSVRCDDGTRSYGFGPSFWAAYREAEAALNQKGDER